MVQKFMLFIACSFGAAAFFGVVDSYAVPVGSWADYADGGWYDAGDARYAGYGVNVPGSSEDYPYLIRSGAELAYLGRFDGEAQDERALVGKYIKLQSDSGVIDLSAHEWAPVHLMGDGNDGRVYFSGEGVVITGMEMVDGWVRANINWNVGAMGLFADTYYAVLSDVTLDGGRIRATRPTGDWSSCANDNYSAPPTCGGENVVGGLVGIAVDTWIRNGAVVDLELDIAPEILGDGFLDGIAIGGLVGEFDYGMISGLSYVRGGSLNYTPGGVHGVEYKHVSERVGGVVGTNRAGTILNACSDIEIRIDLRDDPNHPESASSTYVGGVVGNSIGGNAMPTCVLNSCSHSNIEVLLPTSTENGYSEVMVGGVAGMVERDSMINNYYDGNLKVDGASFSGTQYVGAVVGRMFNGFDVVLARNYYLRGGAWSPMGMVIDEEMLDGTETVPFDTHEELLGLLNGGRQAVVDFAAEREMEGVDAEAVMDWVMIRGEMVCGRIGTVGFFEGVDVERIEVPNTGVVGGDDGGVASVVLLAGAGGMAGVGFGVNRWRLVRKSRIRFL